MEALRSLIHDRNICILGFGKEGKSTLSRLLMLRGYRSLTVADKNPPENMLPKGVCVCSGTEYQARLLEYDIIFKSPGVVIEHETPELVSRICSQTEFFLSRYGHQVIGITGTKGKSTTATLLHHILSQSGRDTLLLGNIGIPAFDKLENVTNNTLVIYELSSHMIEYAKSAPHVAVLLNIFPEHLDHYGTFEKYVAAKQNVYRFQDEDDVLYCNVDQHFDQSICRSRLIPVAFDDGSIIQLQQGDTCLLGRHNLFNIGVVYRVCTSLGITDAEFLKGLRSYRPLPHRMEYVGRFDGVDYYDDSISTACETTIQALESLPGVGTLLLGGMDRGIDYSPLVSYLLRHPVENLILMPDTGIRIAEILQNESKIEFSNMRIHSANSLQEAVCAAKDVTKRGKKCLLSPAAASYGFFNNFEERGEVFQKLVRGDGV